MNGWTSTSRDEQRGLARGLPVIVWLRRHPGVVIPLAAAGILVALLLDLLVPGYAIAGLYLVPVILVAFALRNVLIAIAVSLVCLVLTIVVLISQGRGNIENVGLVCFGVLAGAALIALGNLFSRYDQLYERERSTAVRLQQLTAQLQKLQEVAVLDSGRPRSELIAHIVSHARQLLAGDCAALLRLEGDGHRLIVLAAEGLEDVIPTDLSVPIRRDPIGRCMLLRRPMAVSDLTTVVRNGDDAGELLSVASRTGFGACLAVPLVARQQLFGALILLFRQPRLFDSEDLSLVASFGDQAALTIENARLHEQVERSAVAAERSRLARDLHDSVTQSLFAASLKAEALGLRWRSAEAGAKEGLAELERLNRAALAEMRTLLLEMRPESLADAWLGDLLKQLADAARGRTKIPVSARISGRVSLPREVTIALYRIAQESLNNVVRHSKATRAWVMLRCREDSTRLVIGDDGRGFDSMHVGPEKFGLRIMRERAEAVGASLEVQNRKGGGTVVTAVWCQAGEQTHG